MNQKNQNDGYKFHEPPKANWKISLGEIPDAYATYICIYVKKTTQSLSTLDD
jgi:hypothetical protein